MNDLYMRLTYPQYKNLERQLTLFANEETRDQVESEHRTVEGGYHKALRLEVTETMIIELQGPLIKPPLEG